jgi:two-component system sensor histidine kinase VicK
VGRCSFRNYTQNEKIKIFHGSENVINTELQFFSNANNRIDTCMNYTRPQLAVALDPIRHAFVHAKNRGVRLRYLTEITTENISFCKQLLSTVVSEIRHLDGIKGNFMISESEYLAPAVLLEEGKVAARIMYSNVKELVEEHEYMFDTLWSKAISAEQRIREIEEGVEPEFFDVTTDRERVCRIFVDLASSAKEEMLALLPNDKSMVRLDRLGVIDHMIRASQNGTIIKIICPLSEENSAIVRKISEQASNIRILNGVDLPYGMYIADNKKFLRAELKVPNADNIYESVGFATYSNSKLSVESSKSIFELLWNERVVNEELKRTDKMQKEFINVAAHELRTPIQPILSFSQLLQADKSNNAKEQKFLDAIVRNAKRLQRLTENILDVTRIESHSLQLRKERFNLNENIRNVINDVNNQAGFRNNNNRTVSILFEPEQDLIVEADKVRINEIISNLLKNAIQFTKEGNITIAVAIEKTHYNEIIISIKDTGTGIDPEIFPRLFTKFASKSFEGTGLGLFISKSIIKAHGGRIWAENNGDGKGAMFYFTLPLNK